MSCRRDGHAFQTMRYVKVWEDDEDYDDDIENTVRLELECMECGEVDNEYRDINEVNPNDIISLCTECDNEIEDYNLRVCERCIEFEQ